MHAGQEISPNAESRLARAEVAKPPSDDQLNEWYKKNNISADQDGVFTHLPYGDAPASDECIVEQVKANALRDDIANLRGEVYKKATMVFVAGGPSLRDFIPEIREKCADSAYDVYTSNRTCIWMLNHGMKPKYHVIIDPMARKKHDLEYDADDITVLLGLQCHPEVYEEAQHRQRKVLKFLAASTTRKNSDISDADAAKAALTKNNPELIAIGGGSMAGTRMIYLAHALGYRRIEYYGFDACVEYDGSVVRGYAYEKIRNEAVIEVTAANNRVFHSTLSFARQADEIVKLMENLPGLDVVVHGDSFMSNQVAMFKELNKPADYRISPEYRALQNTMHDLHERYGVSGAEHAARVFMAGAQIVRKFGSCDILDYGCGKETLRIAMEAVFPSIPGMTIKAYDPGRPGFDAEPEGAQVVVCTDVMEHIEPQCIDAVLRHISTLAEHVAIIDVALTPAIKTLPDGRNAHISLHNADWWVSFIKKYFVIIEQVSNPQSLLVVGQPIAKWNSRLALKAVA